MREGREEAFYIKGLTEDGKCNFFFFFKVKLFAERSYL